MFEIVVKDICWWEGDS